MSPQSPDLPPANPKTPGLPAPKFRPGQAAAGVCTVLILTVLITVSANTGFAEIGITLFGLLPFLSLLLVLRPRTRSFGLGLLLTSGLLLLIYLTICGGGVKIPASPK